MANDFSLKGLKTVSRRLNKEIKALESKSTIGLIHAAILLQRDMETTSPTIPLKDNNLRQSWFRNILPGNRPGLLIGFSANYATFVHENLEAVNWTRKGSGPKFLEKALERNHKEILEEISKSIKLK